MQRFLAWLGDGELYWIAVERGRAAAEASDEPLAMAASAWSVAMAMRADGYVDEALRVNARGMALVAPRLEGRDPTALSAYGRLALQAAVSCGLDGRGGDAWRHLSRADEAARALPRGFWDAECCFSMSNVQVHAASIGVGLHAPAEVISRAEQVDADAIPSIERRSRFLLDLALAYDEQKESVSALTLLRKAFDETPENIRYVPQARTLAGGLARAVKGPMSREAHTLASEIGVEAE